MSKCTQFFPIHSFNEANHRIGLSGCPLRAYALTLVLALVALGIGAQPSGLRITATPGKTKQISQYAITWFFEDSVEFGQFVNGDYWVVGPVTLVDIDPLSTVGTGGWTVNGSMLNPHRGLTQGYDSRPSAGDYSAINNVGRPNGNTLSSTNPLVIEPGNSLVSAKSRSTPDNWPQITDASVLTVVAAPPPAGSFRPPYTNTSKAYRWNVNDVKWDWLKSVQVDRSQLDSSPDLQEMARAVERVWLDHGQSWEFTRFHPANNMADYGRDIAKEIGDVVLTLLLNYTQDQLEPVLIRALQVGIDLFGLAEGGQSWNADGGIFLGRKLPILFAGMAFNDDAMLNIADASQNYIFQEDQQTNFIDQDLVDVSQSGLISEGGCWNPDTRGSNIPYTDGTDATVNMVGWPEWGIRYNSWLTSQCSSSVWAPDAAWDATYRMINSAGTTGHALAATVMGARAVWNWEPFFDYHDRFVQAGRDGEHSSWIRNGATNDVTSLVYDFWELYRGDYGALWRP